MFTNCRIEIIKALENVVLLPQYSSLYSIFRFILQIFFEAGKLRYIISELQFRFLCTPLVRLFWNLSCNLLFGHSRLR